MDRSGICLGPVARSVSAAIARGTIAAWGKMLCIVELRRAGMEELSVCIAQRRRGKVEGCYQSAMNSAKDDAHGHR